MKVQVIDAQGTQEITINRMTDISTAMFAILKSFNEQVKVDEVLNTNDELSEQVKQLGEENEELREQTDALDSALRKYGFDEIDEFTEAYDEAVTVLNDIHDMVREY